jgi:hypothetical protein
MAARASILGDAGDNHPDHWIGGLASPNLHAIVILFAKDDPERDRCRVEHGKLIASCKGVELLWALDLLASPPFNYAHDHFGYRDRTSQPVIEGAGETPTPGSGPPLKAGECILGYPDEQGPAVNLPKPEVLSRNATADTLPRFPRTTLTVQLDADIKTNVDIAILTPAYTLATPIWGGRLGFNLFIPVGTARTEIDALLTGALGPIGFANQSSVSDRLTSFGDPAPQLTLKWNEGVNNFMVYSRGGIPIGDYDPDRIVNLGDGHASWDNGFGYTYFNATTGLEFSAVSGLTYNFRNPHTDYQNGIDWHVDLEASRFLTKQFYVGAVGYSFNQLTGDTGSGATLGPYISRISAVGPEVGVLFPVGGMQSSLNLRGYWEFAAQNRSSGWNTWLVFSIAPSAPAEKTPVVVK